MKKLLFLAALLFVAHAGFSQVSAAASGTTANADLALAVFETQNFDFGKIKQGIPATHEFKFKNTSKVPMVITNVQASCGCTTPTPATTGVP